MKLALRWKITLAFTTLTALVLLGLYVYLHRAVLDNTLTLSEQSLLTTARVMAREVPPPPWSPGPGLQALAATYDRAAQARLTLIDGDGTVVADSRQSPAEMENHSGRPERVAALSQGWGTARHISRTLGGPMVYVAVPVGQTGSHGAVLRLSRPVEEAGAASTQLQQVMLVAFVVAVGLVWLLSLLLTASLMQPVQHLLRVARRIHKGDFAARAEPLQDPELGELATVFNSALDSLGALAARSEHESRHYAAILQQMGDAVVIVNRAGRVEFVNPTFARLFGVAVETVQGRSSEEIALNYELSALLLRAVEQKSVQHDEVRLLHPEPRQLATVVTPLVDEQGHVIGAIGLLRDVTDLQRLDEVRREFVANASHELRTPAAGIKALAEALQVGALKDPEKGPRFVQQIVDSADRLTSILDDMLTLTRVERGRELLSVAPLSVAETVGEAAEQIRLAAEAKRLALKVEIAAQDQMQADARGLHTILLNLLDNAVKYTPEGGAVAVKGRPVPGGYELSVSDTGPGIAPEHQDRVFERFYRVDKARDRATGGTGLGLSIVKHIMEAHGGRVSLRSTPEGGSTFTVFFPAPS